MAGTISSAFWWPVANCLKNQNENVCILYFCFKFCLHFGKYLNFVKSFFFLTIMFYSVVVSVFLFLFFVFLFFVFLFLFCFSFLFFSFFLITSYTVLFILLFCIFYCRDQFTCLHVLGFFSSTKALILSSRYATLMCLSIAKQQFPAKKRLLKNNSQYQHKIYY